jgi:spore coat protein U-like protein
MKRGKLLVLMLAAFLWSAPAMQGGTLQNSLPVSVNVVATCVATTSPVDFGNVDLQSQAMAAGQIQVKCNGQVPYDIVLDAGLHYDGYWRGIANGAQRIQYGLYDSNNKEWGDNGYENTYPWGFAVPSVGNGAWQTYSVTGKLFPGPVLVAPGLYTDTVQVTLHF